MPRISVNLSDDAYQTLEKLAQDKGKPITQVVRDSVGLEKWFEETRKEGARVLVEREGKVREVIPR
jgi:hypothetical protein